MTEPGKLGYTEKRSPPKHRTGRARASKNWNGQSMDIPGRMHCLARHLARGLAGQNAVAHACSVVMGFGTNPGGQTNTVCNSEGKQKTNAKFMSKIDQHAHYGNEQCPAGYQGDHTSSYFGKPTHEERH